MLVLAREPRLAWFQARGSIGLEKRYRGLREAKTPSYFSALANGFNRSLLILSTMPALRSATSLTLYSADVPSTCATSEGVGATFGPTATHPSIGRRGTE